MIGSPPLTRGPLRNKFADGLDGRITPAHAGTTRQPDLIIRGDRDHPRSRGDHRDAQATFLTKTGSPPLTRGPQQIDLDARKMTGITPAHAGTTSL